MASQKAARRSRKRRSIGKVPRAVPSQRRERVAAAEAKQAREQRRRHVAPGAAYGERPPGPFGGFPASEIAILAGVVGVAAGWFERAWPALIAGVVACVLGVLELTTREHFSGYRSHSTLLAGMIAVGVETAVALLIGRSGFLLLLVVVPVFALAFWLLRKRFMVARQARLRAIPPA